MQVRKVEIDFSDAKVHWNSKEPEFSHVLNAVSSFVPDLEPFLIKVVRKAQDRLPSTATELAHDVDTFVAQESRHFKQHLRFNELLYAAGYDGLKAEQARMRADFDRFFEEKSLKFSLAYCEGFETFAPLLSRLLFEEADRLEEDWHEPTVFLWLWHMAEEYEHRTLCNYLYKEVYDDYLYRVYALWYSNLHQFAYIIRVANQLIKKDLETGVIKGKLRSRFRFARTLMRFNTTILPTMVLQCMRPGYDPAGMPPPKRALELLDEIGQRYGVAASMLG